MSGPNNTGGFSPTAGQETEVEFNPATDGLNTKHSYRGTHMKGIGYREDNGNGGKL